ncbi:MAG: hypothetical protein ACR2MP_34855 [Streptosporangiaceae bacterium]
MTPTALPARLTARGYLPVSHPTTHPQTWPGLVGPAGSVRVILDPGSDCTEICGLGPRPAGPMISGIGLSAGAPEAITAGTLNTAEAWLTGRLQP